MWQKTAREVENLTNITCTAQKAENKWKSLKRKYIKKKSCNNSSGGKIKSCSYLMVMDDVLFKKPEVVVPATCSIFKGLNVRQEENEMNEENKPTTSFQRKRKLKIGSVEKRHQEKMQRIDNLNASINRLIDCTIAKKQLRKRD